jgi:3-methyladenine DNA glycosylase AlkD
VKKPARQWALRPVFRAHPLATSAEWRTTVWALFSTATHREAWYGALDLLGHRPYDGWLDLDALPLCERLIVTGAWWDVVDEVAIRRVGPILQRHRDAVTPVLRAWSKDADRWRRRAAIVAQNKHREATCLVLLADVIDANLDDPDFFIGKGIGWALREKAYTHPDRVIAFVGERRSRLSTLARREALRNLWKAGRALELQ